MRQRGGGDPQPEFVFPWRRHRWSSEEKIIMFLRILRRKKRLLLIVVSTMCLYLVLKGRTANSPFTTAQLDELYSTKDDEFDDLKSPLYYTSPNYPDLAGQPFAVNASYLRELRLLTRKYVKLDDRVVRHFVFATAASSAFFDMVKETVMTVQKYRPENRIIVYDLGLTRIQAHEVKSLCGVEYRKFGYSIYPPHVRRRNTYAWKPLIIADVLTRHPGVFWMDSSVRLITGDFDDLLRQVQETGGALSLTTTGHSLHAATNPAMYAYLPAGSPPALAREEQREATVLLYRSRPVMLQVVRWLVLCALDPKCIAPQGASLGCIWRTSDHMGEYANCHRYDQSAFNLLMMNYVRGGSSLSYYARSRVCRINRYATGKVIPKYCGNDRSNEDLEAQMERQ